MVQGVVIGLSVSIPLYLLGALGEHLNRGDYDKVNKHIHIENVSFSDPVEERLGKFITITFQTDELNTKKVRRYFVDVEFFAADGTFLFGHEHAGSWDRKELPPKRNDNVSLEIPLPGTIDFDEISNVNVDLIELVR